jgi:hypothetical protein
MDVAGKFHLEIDGIAFRALHSRGLLLKAPIGGGILPSAQGIEQGADPGNRRKSECLAPRLSPLINPAHQHGQPQGTRIVVGRSANPVARTIRNFIDGSTHDCFVALYRQAKYPRKGILHHARRKSLHIRRRERGKTVSRQGKGFHVVICHTAIPSIENTIMPSWNMRMQSAGQVRRGRRKNDAAKRPDAIIKRSFAPVRNREN